MIATFSGVAGRVGQIVDGVYVAHPDWTVQDLADHGQ